MTYHMPPFPFKIPKLDPRWRPSSWRPWHPCHTHFVQLYPQPLYTASQVRTTSRSWDTGVLTDLCLTLYYAKPGAQNIVKEIKQYQGRWLQHVQRMDTNRLPKQAPKYKPKGRRNIGRPRNRWRDQLHLENQGTG